MEVFLVGGAVRDKLLNLPVTDRDWVVVGATESQLLEQGYTSVGKDFPVFLHPKTREEYALARIERKTGKGHRGFVCDANANVSLEEDLKRRDLTINAIAESQQGQLIDPFNGIQDLENRVFKHVSEAFAEDPLRVIRLARFSARFPEFTIHKDTQLLMKDMVAKDELSELAVERIYAEIDKALDYEHPQLFFSVMEQVGAHARIFPEITASGISLLEKISRITVNKDDRLAALLWPNETGEVKQLNKRLKLPRHLVELAELSCFLFKGWQLQDLTSGETIVNWFYQADAFRRKDRFIRLNQLFSLMTRVTHETDNSDKWLNYFHLAETIKAKDLISQYSGPELGRALRKAQAVVIENSGSL